MTIHINILETVLTIIALYCVIVPVVVYREEIKSFLKQVFRKSPPEIIPRETIERAKPEDIMGKSLSSQSHKLHGDATSDMAGNKPLETPKKGNTFETENKNTSNGVIPKEELDKLFSNGTEEINADFGTDDEDESEGISKEELEEENEELEKYNNIVEGKLSSGVSFDELETVKKVMTADKITEKQAVEAAVVIQKIEDTQLFGQLKANISNAESKVNAIMDKVLYGKKDELLFYEVESADDFDIWKAV